MHNMSTPTPHTACPLLSSGQDPEAAEVRAKLLKDLAAAEVAGEESATPSKGKDGRVRSGIMMHNARGCFTKGGELAMSILYYRPQYLGIGLSLIHI